MSVVRIPGLVVDETNGAAGDNYYEIEMQSQVVQCIFIDFKITSYTVTIEANVDQDGLTSGERWSDITDLLTGGPSSITASGVIWVPENLPIRKLRIKYVRSNATNELEVRIGKLCR